MASPTVPCPGCAGPLGLDEEVCPHCRRPRDEYEIERGKEELAARALAVKRRPRVLALRAAGLAVLTVLFLQRRVLLGAAVRWSGRASAALKDYTDPDYVAGRVPLSTAATAAAAPAAPPPAASPAPPPGFPPPLPPLRPSSRPAPPETGSAAAVPPPEPAAKARPAPTPAAPAATNWLFYGVVFDFATEQPVRGAKVVIHRSRSGADEVCYTDADGHYLTSVAYSMTGDDDFTVEVVAEGYRRGQMEDHNPSWLELSDAPRLEALREVTEGDLAPIPFAARPSNGLVSLDMVLVPEKRPP